MSTGHQMLTYAICTHQQRTKIFIILVQRMKRGKQEESWCFGLRGMGPTSLYWATTENGFFLEVCESNTGVHTDLLYVWRMCIKIVCGKGGDCSFGCNRRPWHLRGLQQCGKQAGTVILAMYTFVVGPWLPQTRVISSGLIRKPEKQKRAEC